MVKVLLIRPAKIKHNAGEVVDISPAEAHFLLSVNSAIKIEQEAPKKRGKPKK